jgi:hypothetical protein
VVTETGWPTTFGPIGAQQVPVGISNASDYLQRVTGWAQAQQVVLYIHNMFDDQYGVKTTSPFNYHFGLIDDAGKPKGDPTLTNRNMLFSAPRTHPAMAARRRV